MPTEPRDAPSQVIMSKRDIENWRWCDEQTGATRPEEPMKHTAGPWHVGPHYKSDVESSFGRVCECGITRGPQAEADARLIAAAPELLVACTALVEGWTAMDSEEQAAVNAAKAAIQKAEG